MVFRDAAYDILRSVNVTVWDGIEGVDKIGKIIKTGISGADVVIGISHALEDFGSNDVVCSTINMVGSISSTVSLVLGNISTTKHLTLITGSVTDVCRFVRYYYKNYGTFWGCTVAAGQGVKKVIKFTIKQ